MTTQRRKSKTPLNKNGTRHGGARKGAGRPLGSGSGPSPLSRRNRVSIMLTDKELKKLERGAKRKGLPLSTHAYHIVERRLAREK